MKLEILASVAIAINAFASPINERQVNGLLGSLAGTLGVNQSFDYIVLGGGTGGLTIAKRLAEDPSTTVAVIEAAGLYQVGDPVIEQTPGGDVTFVGNDQFLASLALKMLTLSQEQRRLCRLLIGASLPRRILRQIIRRELMLEENVLVAGRRFFPYS